MSVVAGSKANRTLLYIDMAYSLAELRQRGQLQFFEQRHSNGYFNTVIGLHPLVDLVAATSRPVERKRFSDWQDVIEAKSAAIGLPKWLYPLDLVITQRRLLADITAIARKESVSLIAATDPLYSGLFGLWLKRRTGLPLVIHLIGNYDLNFELSGRLAMPKLLPSRALERRVIRHVLRNADLVAAGTETIRHYAISQGAKPDWTEIFRVAKHVIPAHRKAPQDRKPLSEAERERLGISRSRELVLTVARLEPVKMVDHSIRAFAVVHSRHPDAMLLIAGEGSQREALQGLARELGIGDKVKFLGLVDQGLLARLAPGCVALSPLTGIALIETSLAGCPAVAYDCDSAVAELVETGVTGTLLKPLDWKGMGHAAADLFDDPIALQRQGQAIRSRAEWITDEKALYAHEHRVFDRLLARDNHRQ
jgi:glycosyltransferase involved in cell wall biosynthesis